MQKLLIVEDDEKLRNELNIFLSKNGYAVQVLEQFENCLSDIIKEPRDLILLDINLPFTDGEYLCKEIRKVSEVPIIMITSRDNELDELLCINYGADDYVTKPFNTQILLARIASILKRSKLDSGQNKINCDDFILNLSKSSIEKDSKETELTKNEFKILHFLVQKKGQIVSREDIMEYLWDSESFIDDNTLTVNMNRLRKKLEDIGLKDRIQTKRGQGYLLD